MDYQNSFDIFLSGGSPDAAGKVWCKLVELSRKSSKKYSADLREHVDIQLLTLCNIVLELWAKNAFTLKIAPPAGHFWYVSHRGHSITPLLISFP